MTTTGETPVIVRDIYPAEVVTAYGPGGPGEPLTEYRQVRVILTTDRLLVYSAPDELTVDVAYDADQSVILPEWQLRQAPMRITTATGEYLVNKTGGCGCGNPLKTWQPFAPMRYGRA